MTTDFPTSENAYLSPFEAIRRTNEDGAEYWSARELARLLDYVKLDKFKIAIERAQKACQNSGYAASDHFLQSEKLISAGKGAQRTIEDYHLSRYACYLIVEHATRRFTCARREHSGIAGERAQTISGQTAAFSL